MKKIVWNPQQNLNLVKRDVINEIEEHGFALLNSSYNSREALLKLANALGTVQSHMVSDIDGIIGDGNHLEKSWKEYQDQYIGLSKNEFSPHTDGTYLDGILIEDNRVSRVGPPKLLLLQCVHPASEGGTNYIIDEKQVLIDLLKNDPASAQVLLSCGCVTFCRDDQIALNFPVFERRKDNSFRMRFRYDFTTFCPNWSLEAIHKLHNEYHMDKARQIMIDLKEGDILIMDNHRVLHSREAFDASLGENRKRKMRILWLNDDEKDDLNAIQPQPEGKKPRALGRYFPYNMKPRSDRDEFPKIKTGIRLPEHLLKMADDLIRDQFDIDKNTSFKSKKNKKEFST